MQLNNISTWLEKGKETTDDNNGSLSPALAKPVDRFTTDIHMKKIFIQEPDESIMNVLSILIESEGFQVIGSGASGPKTALALRREKPVLALLDFSLTGEACLKTCKIIKTYLPAIPIIAMSCNPNLQSIRRDYNFDAWLEKPFDIYRLTSLIHRMVSGPKKIHKLGSKTCIKA